MWNKNRKILYCGTDCGVGEQKGVEGGSGDKVEWLILSCFGVLIPDEQTDEWTDKQTNERTFVVV